MIRNFNAEKRENKMLLALWLIAGIAVLYYFLRPFLVMTIMPDAILPEGNAFLAWWVLPELIAGVICRVFQYAYTKSVLNTVSFEIDGERVVCSVEGIEMVIPKYEKAIKLIHVTHDGLSVLPEMNGAASSTGVIRYKFKTESGRNVYLFADVVVKSTIDVYVDDEFVISKNMLIKNRLAAVA